MPVEGALLVELASAMTGLATGKTEDVIANPESFVNRVESSNHTVKLICLSSKGRPDAPTHQIPFHTRGHGTY